MAEPSILLKYSRLQSHHTSWLSSDLTGHSFSFTHLPEPQSCVFFLTLLGDLIQSHGLTYHLHPHDPQHASLTSGLQFCASSCL